MRRRHVAVRAALGSTQVDTPRFAKSPQLPPLSTTASYDHRTVPVAGSSAIARPNGVERNNVPSTINGVASSLCGLRVCSVSPVRYVHADVRRLTFAGVISVSGEWRSPSDVRPYADHSPFDCATQGAAAAAR